MVMKRRRVVGAAVLALLIAGAAPSAALADTDIVLENHSEGSEVHTGDSEFNNNSNEATNSSGFNSSASGFAPAPAPAAAPSAVSAPVTQSAPAQTAADTPETAVQSADSEAIDALFVGFAPTVGSVL
jgi:hypothetical protein